MQQELREKILVQIKQLGNRLERVYQEIDDLKQMGKFDLADKVEKTELAEIDKAIMGKWDEYAQSLDSDYGERVLSLNDIYNLDLPEQEWLVDRLIPDLGITAISGVPGAYKSWLSVYIAKSVDKGELLFDRFQCGVGPVLIVDLENNLRLIRDRLKLINLDGSSSVYYWKPPFQVDNDQDFKKLKQVVEEKKIKLLIFDSLVRIHGGDENDAGSMSKVFKRLKELAEKEVAVVFIHHSRKQSFFNKSSAGESMRGSSDILAAIDSHLLLEKTKEGLKVTQSKLRQDEPIKPFNLKVITGDSFGFEYAGEVEEALDKLTQAREEVVRLLQATEMTRQEVIEGLKEVCGSVSADKALKGLMAEKIIDRKSGVNNQYTYYLVGNNQEEQMGLTV